MATTKHHRGYCVVQKSRGWSSRELWFPLLAPIDLQLRIIMYYEVNSQQVLLRVLIQVVQKLS